MITTDTTTDDTTTTAVTGPAYARLSKKGKRQRVESIPLQWTRIEQLAQWRGAVVGPRFEDGSLSAWDEDVWRQGWEDFLAELDTGRWHYAFSYHADRLARNGRDSERLLSIGKRHGIVLLTPEGTYDLGSDDGRAMFRHLATMVINQSDATSRRARNHKDGARRAGVLRVVYGGPPPLGFRQGTDDWEVDPDQAAWLADVAQAILDDTEHQVATAYAAAPPMRTSGGQLVTEKMLRAALQRPATAGRIMDRDGTTVLGWADAGGPLPDATFARLQVVFASRRRGRPVKAGEYWLGPALRCAKCGNQLTGQPGYKGRPTYACKNPHAELGVAKPCRGVSIPAADVHDLVKAAVEVWADSPAARQAAARTPQTAGRRAALEADQADLEAQLLGLDAKRLRMRTAAARQGYDQLAAEAERQLADVAAQLAQLADLEAGVGTDVPVVVGNWGEMTGTEKHRAVVQAVVTPLVVQPGNGGARALAAADRMEVDLRQPAA